jgi:hypothetical protein
VPGGRGGGGIIMPVGEKGGVWEAFGDRSQGNTLEETHSFLILSYFVPSPLSRQLAMIYEEKKY